MEQGGRRDGKSVAFCVQQTKSDNNNATFSLLTSSYFPPPLPNLNWSSTSLIVHFERGNDKKRKEKKRDSCTVRQYISLRFVPRCFYRSHKGGQAEGWPLIYDVINLLLPERDGLITP